MNLFDNFMAPYIPHVVAARDRCVTWGAATFGMLSNIRDLIADGNEPDVNYSYGLTVNTVAAGDPFTVTVPLDEMWKVDYFYMKSSAADALVSLQVNGQLAFGAIGLASGSVSDGLDMVLRPGSRLSFVTNGVVVNGIMQYKRYKLDPDGVARPARSAGGKEGRYSSSGALHEGERDVMDINVPVAVLPVPRSSNEV